MAIFSNDARSPNWIGAFCATLAVVAGLAILVAGLAWSKQNPYASYWDEAGYFNSTTLDYWALRDHRPLRSRIETIVKDAVGQPPAHRAVILFTYFTGPKPALLRIVSLLALLVTASFMFFTGKRLAGVAAGGLAALFVLVSPSVVANSIRFGTEYPLYLAEAAMLYFLLSHFGREAPGRYDRLGLGLAIGLGLWSKPSFLTVAIPILAVALFFSYRKSAFAPEPGWIWRAILIGTAIGAVFWLPLGLRTIHYVHRASIFERHSLGRPSLHTLLEYCSIIVSTATGPIVAVLVALAAIGTLVLCASRSRTRPFATRDLAVICICVAGVVPFTVVQFLSANHDMRLLSPVIVPLALAFAVAVTRVLFVRSPERSAVVAAAVFAQVALMLLPLREDPKQLFAEFRQKAVVGNTGDSVATVFAPTEQWDWSRLSAITDPMHLKAPLIAYVGAGDPFNRMQIVWPWLQRDDQITPAWLWRYEYGTIRWDRVMDAADNHSDVVLTAPGYRGLSADKQPLDNVHSAEFAQRLERDPNFKPPIRLAFGPYEPTTLLVFINKRAGSLTPPPVVNDRGDPIKGRKA